MCCKLIGHGLFGLVVVLLMVGLLFVRLVVGCWTILWLVGCDVVWFHLSLKISGATL